MSLVDITDIVDRVFFWIHKSDPNVPKKIAAAYEQKGGWEGWAQVEIAYIIKQKYPNVTIDREVNVYAGTGKENDFVVTQTGKPNQVIELKCERITQTATQFKDAFESDIKKVNTFPIDKNYKPAKAYVVGISCTKASVAVLKQTSLFINKHVTLIELGGDIGIWWYEKDIV